MEYTVEQQVNNAIKWIDELLVTKAKQGKGQLGNHYDGFCCLGFGCSIILEPKDWRGGNGTSDEFKKSVGLAYANGYTILLDGNKQYFEIPTDIGVLAYGGNQNRSLASLNDDYEWGLNAMGRIIKYNVSKLFIGDVAKGIINHYQNHE